MKRCNLFTYKSLVTTGSQVEDKPTLSDLGISKRESAGAWRLSKLGWTREQIGELLGVDQDQVSRDMQNSHLGKLHNDLAPDWNDKGIGNENP